MTNMIRVAGVFALLIFCFAGANAQSRKQNAAAIKYARATLVSDLEKGMPRSRFETWFRQLAGTGMKISWDVNDCGEQTGTDADRGRDFPMCVQATAESLDVYISVSVQLGTFKRGISRSKPVVRSMTVSVEGEGRIDADKLSELPKKLKELGG